VTTIDLLITRHFARLRRVIDVFIVPFLDIERMHYKNVNAGFDDPKIIRFFFLIWCIFLSIQKKELIIHLIAIKKMQIFIISKRGVIQFPFECEHHVLIVSKCRNRVLLAEEVAVAIAKIAYSLWKRAHRTQKWPWD